jgi:DNA-directed RNA polymerase specialized sigma24 family protein
MTQIHLNKMWAGLWHTPATSQQDGEPGELLKLENAIHKLSTRKQSIKTQMAGLQAMDSGKTHDDLRLEYRAVNNLLSRAREAYQARRNERSIPD